MMNLKQNNVRKFIINIFIKNMKDIGYFIGKKFKA